MAIKILHRIENHPKLVEEVLALIEELGTEHNQISCQMTEIDSADWFESVGPLEELLEGDENKYRHIPKRLAGTEIEKLINRYQGFRTRIMVMDPRKCYSVHSDITPRVHIPIITNDQAWMIWPYDNVCYNLKPGVSYWTDTRKKHTFLNGDKMQTRIHLVMNTVIDI
jgi:hypothetical protein